MRLLLDECMPRRLKREFVGHEVSTVDEAGLKGLKNGQLLRVASGAFDVLITVDRKLSREQKLSDFEIGVMVLLAPSNRFEDLEPLIPRVIGALRVIKPGEAVEVSR